MESVKIAVLFDLDGTLHDSERLAREVNDLVFEQKLGRVLTTEERQFFIGRPIRDVMKSWFPGEEEVVLQNILGTYEQRHHEISPYDGVLELLTSLQQAGVKMGIVSSKMKRYAIKEMQNTGLDRFFEVVVTLEDCPEHKPHPRPLLEAAAKLNVQPNTCYYVGDQPTDLQAAHQAGMRAVAALWGEGDEARLMPHDPDLTVQTPQELWQRISEHI